MMNEKRRRLEDELLRFTYEQLNQFVSNALGHSLEYFVTRGPNLRATVTNLLEELGKVEKQRFLFLTYMYTNVRSPGLRRAINEYLGFPPPPDPYRALAPLNEPFVNRSLLRDALQQLFSNQGHRALVTLGPRYSGRSHSRWLIEHVAQLQEQDTQVLLIDLIDEEGATNVVDIIGQIINEMRLDPKDFRDRIAQGSTQTKGFVTAMRGHARDLRDENRHWCLVFDHYDREEVDAAAHKLVVAMIKDASENRLPNINIIVLGHTTSLDPYLDSHRVLQDNIVALTRSDVERYLNKLAQEKEAPMSQQDLHQNCDEIFNGLSLPLDLNGMKELSNRLRPYL